MGGGGGAIKRVDKIRQIVRLKQVMQRWKNMSLSGNRSDHRDSDSFSGSHHRRTPSGFLAVYVGVMERERFIIPTRFLNLPVFVSLLNKAEEEFGFQSSGGLVLPCDVEFFKQVLKFLEREESRYGGLGLDEFLKIVSDQKFDSCKESSRRRNHGYAGAPLLQKTRV